MKRTRLAPMSPRRRANVDARTAVCAQVRKRDVNCQAPDLVPSVRCGGVLEVHEIIPRSAWALGYLEPSNCVLVCSRHHEWIGDHPDFAHDLGLHGYSYERPDYVGPA